VAGPSVVALILAAGIGERLGEPTPKAFLPLAGRPMALFSLEAAAASGAVDALVLVVPATVEREAVGAMLSAGSLSVPVDVVSGGATRQDSVRLGLRAVLDGTAIVVIHDAARPFASPGLFARVVAAVRDGAGPPHGVGVVPVVPSPDTVKRVRGGRVVETVPRAEASLAQTPQAFSAGRLRDAHARAAATGTFGTDDAMLFEAAGYPVMAVPGEATNFKVTTPEDLDRAERLARSRSAPAG
jgi:2-C-methyl-D-erythritol 4-phosphate cytidylyltransferase